MGRLDDISVEELRYLDFFFRFLKNFTRMLAGCAAVLGLLITSPAFPNRTRVKLTAENPLYVVDTLKFGKALLNEVANSNISASVVSMLNSNLSQGGLRVTLGETGERIIFFREWHSTTKQVQFSTRHISGDEIAEWQTRAALGQRKRFLGYTDKEAEFEWGKMSRRGENIEPVDRLTGDPAFFHSDLLMRYEAEREQRFGNSGRVYGHDPFYEPIETLPKNEKLTVYSLLADASQSYSWWLLQNVGRDDEFDIRIIANVSSNDLAMDVLNSFGIKVEESTYDAVRLRVATLSPGLDKYKYVVLQGSPQPFKKDVVRLDRKPFLEQLGGYWLWLLLVSFLLATFETYIQFIKQKRGEVEALSD